jgi:two-component system, OmpR family, sensor histidine kinase MprB
MSLRARMGLGAGVAVAVAVIAVAVSAYAGTSSELRGQIDNSLRKLTTNILAPPPNQGNGGPGRPGGQFQSGIGFRAFGEGPCERDEGTGIDARNAPSFGGAAGTVTLIYPSSCGGGSYVPTAQASKIPIDSRMKTLADTGSGQYFTEMHVNGTHIRVLVTGIGRDGALAVALPLTEVDTSLSSQLLLLTVIAAAGIALAALLGFLVARTAIAPITRFTRQTEAIAAKPELIESERVKVEGTDELARLARTFNTTLDALERSIESQRNLVADASHELRTPIASIRANLQLLRDEELLSLEDRAALRGDMIHELDELTALVSDVVELARGSKPSAAPGEVRVDEIAGDAVERTRRRAPELTIEAALEPTLVHGEGERIARAVSNLLDNARKWNPPGETIEVELRGGTLSVRDHGPGFHEEDLPVVFDRFHRARDARSKPGSGLGLAIVRQAAEAHGGFAEASNAPGGGALLRLNFGPVLQLGEEASESPIGAP